MGMGIATDWEKEAVKRKLSNNKNTPDALQVLAKKESLELFRSMNVMSEVEVRARQEVELEAYIMHVQIEGRVFNELIYSYVIPSVVEYQNRLIKNVRGLKEIYGTSYQKKAKGQLVLIEEISGHLEYLKEKTDAMVEERKKANIMTDTHKKAYAYCDEGKTLLRSNTISL